jgi:hypothetical protein
MVIRAYQKNTDAQDGSEVILFDKVGITAVSLFREVQSFVFGQNQVEFKLSPPCPPAADPTELAIKNKRLPASVFDIFFPEPVDLVRYKPWQARELGIPV